MPITFAIPSILSPYLQSPTVRRLLYKYNLAQPQEHQIAGRAQTITICISCVRSLVLNSSWTVDSSIGTSHDATQNYALYYPVLCKSCKEKGAKVPQNEIVYDDCQGFGVFQRIVGAIRAGKLGVMEKGGRSKGAEDIVSLTTTRLGDEPGEHVSRYWVAAAERVAVPIACRDADCEIYGVVRGDDGELTMVGYFTDFVDGIGD